MATNYKLGPLPWSRDTLIKAYWANFIEVAESIKEHPGFSVLEAFQHVQLSLGLFLDNCTDFLAGVSDLKTLTDSRFFSRGNQQIVEYWDRKLRRQFFAVASSAFALVEACRRVSEKFPVTGYEEEITKTFAANELHKFMQDLRNFFTHKHLLTPAVQIVWDHKGKLTQLIVTKKNLNSFTNWSEPAKAYIQRFRFDIDVEAAVIDYRQLVQNFHNWYRGSFSSAYRSEMDEYSSYEKIIKGEGWKVHWRQILDYGLQHNLNPYDYLDQYLTPEELDKVLSLPRGSQEQIDLMISLADEFEICDKQMRNSVYQLFRRAAQNEKQKRLAMLRKAGVLLAVGVIAITVSRLTTFTTRNIRTAS